MAALNFTAPDLVSIADRKEANRQKNLDRLIDSTFGNYGRYKQAERAIDRQNKRDEYESSWNDYIMQLMQGGQTPQVSPETEEQAMDAPEENSLTPEELAAWQAWQASQQAQAQANPQGYTPMARSR